MTTLVPIKPVKLSCSRRSGSTFKPLVGDLMADDSPTAIGSATGGSGNGRLKRELEPGGAQLPPPAKRMSPIPSRSSEGHREHLHGGAGLSDLRLENPSPQHFTETGVGPLASASGSLMGQSGSEMHSRVHVPVVCPRAHPAVRRTDLYPNGESPARTENTNSNPVKLPRTWTANEGSSQPSVLWENAPSLLGEEVNRSYSASAGGGVGFGGLTTPIPMAVNQGYRRDVLKPSPQQNSGAVDNVSSMEGAAIGQRAPKKEGSVSASHAYTEGTNGGPSTTVASAFMTPAQSLSVVPPTTSSTAACSALGYLGHPNGGEGSRADADSPGGSRRGMKRPLVGGVRASNSWDGGCASNAPPGSGGGLSAAPACRACVGDGGESGVCPGDVGGLGGGSGAGEIDQGDGSCGPWQCKNSRPSSTFSPLSFGRTSSMEGGTEGRRQSLPEDVLFPDHIISQTLNLPYSPAVGLSSSGGTNGNSGGGGGSSTGVDGGSTTGVEGLDLLLGGEMREIQDIRDCMRTLQASPTVSPRRLRLYSQRETEVAPVSGFCFGSNPCVRRGGKSLVMVCDQPNLPLNKSGVAIKRMSKIASHA